MSKSQIRTIDYKDMKSPDIFVESLRNSGFAVIYNHDIDMELINTVYKEWKDFFYSKEKYNYLFDLEKQDGYFPMKSENAKDSSLKDIKEFYHIYLPWGRIPDLLKDNTLKVRSELKKIGLILLKWIDDLTPPEIKKNFSMPLYDMIEGSQTNLLRIIHYPPLREEDDENAIRAGAHEDINLITVLLAGSQPGLQVIDNNNKWVDVESDSGWIVVNIGDMLQECSRGYYPSTTHQVINPTGDNVSRLSMPFFIHPRDEVKLSDRYTAKSYLEERLKQLGLK